MTRTQLSFEDVQNCLEKLPYTQYKDEVELYAQKQNSYFSNTFNQLVVTNFVQRLEKL